MDNSIQAIKKNCAINCGQWQMLSEEIWKHMNLKIIFWV